MQKVIGPTDIPEGTSGPMRIVRRDADDPERISGETYTIKHGGRPMPKDETWVGLYEGEKLWMSNTPDERLLMFFDMPKDTPKPIVLIGGLGLGSILEWLQRRRDPPGEVWVVEKSWHVIHLVWPTYEDLPGFNIVCADIHEYRRLVPSRVFDAAFIDIWGDYNTDLIPDMQAARRSLRSVMKPGAGRVTCWNEEYLKSERRRGF